MPCSVHTGKKEVRQWFDQQTDIKTIVDVGPGSGTYAKLFGDKCKMIGIEIWAPYIDQFNLSNLYDEIIIGDIRHTILPEADCIILGDVLEHLKKEDVIKLLKRIDDKYKHVIISMPVDGMAQGAEFGNKYEAHLSHWDFKTMSELTKHYPLRLMLRGDKLGENIIIGLFIK